MSLKNTFFPSFPVPIGSLSKSMSTWNRQKDVTIEIKQLYKKKVSHFSGRTGVDNGYSFVLPGRGGSGGGGDAGRSRV
jgi:hypothetical protein